MKKSYLTATDQFCGAGGSTSGAKAAGVEVRMALNHWRLAIETHNTNHPETDHDCTDVQACDPRRYPSTDILITSPECTNHALAKGKKRKQQGQGNLFNTWEPNPAEERSRATMFDVPRFAEYHNYNIIIVENVVDARLWRMWDGWLKCMHALGYQHECLYLNSMFFHPCPQSRDRLYVVFWKAGNIKPNLEFRPNGYCTRCGHDVETFQSWKNPAKRWGKFKTQYIYRCSVCHNETTPYYFAAFNCIDWSLPGERIGDRKKPLAKNTVRRIEYGLKKYGKQLLTITNRYTSGLDCRVKPAITHPLATQPGDASHAVLSPFLLNQEHSQAQEERVKPSTLPAWTQTTAQATGLVVPFFSQHEHGECRIHNGFKPLVTQTASQTLGVVVPFIINMKKTSPAKSILEQIATVAASGNHHWLVSNYSPGYIKPVTEATGAVTTQDHHGLFRIPVIVENKGRSNAKSAADPLAAITTHEYHGILTDEKLNAFLSYYYGGSMVTGRTTDPCGTVTTGDRGALVMSSDLSIEDCFYRMLNRMRSNRRWHFQTTISYSAMDGRKSGS